MVFNASVTDTGQGIFLDDNVNTTFTFNGALTLSTASPRQPSRPPTAAR